MKNLYLLLFLILQASFVFGQNVTEKYQKAEGLLNEISLANRFNKENIPEIFNEFSFRNINPTLSNSKETNQLKSASLTTLDLNTLNMDSAIMETWIDSTSQWEYKSKENFSYNNNGDPIFVSLSQWDTDSNKWKPLIKIDISYNEAGIAIEQNEYLWMEEANMWFLMIREESIINSNGIVTGTINSGTNYQTLEIEIQSKKEIVYDDKFENVLFETYYNWENDSNRWVKSQKYDYTYEGDNQTQKSVSSWIDSTNQWTENMKFEYTYDNSGNNTIYASYMINDSNVWIGRYKTEYEYTNGEISIETHYDWDKDLGNFIYASKTESFFDEKGLASYDLIYDWDTTINNWVIISKNADAVYNEYDNLLEYTKYLWDKSTNQWLNNSRVSNYWPSPMPSNASKVNNKKILKTYPNPTTDIVHFEIGNTSQAARLELYDLRGQKAMETEFSQGQQINISQLKRGIYFYKISQGETIRNGKIIKE